MPRRSLLHNLVPIEARQFAVSYQLPTTDPDIGYLVSAGGIDELRYGVEHRLRIDPGQVDAGNARPLARN